MPPKLHYEVLGVNESASKREITLAFRKLVTKHHPDHNPGDERTAKARFQEIKEAYDVLTDPLRRAEYDSFGDASPKDSRDMLSHLENQFSAIFGASIHSKEKK